MIHASTDHKTGNNLEEAMTLSSLKCQYILLYLLQLKMVFDKTERHFCHFLELWSLEK